MDKEEPKKRRKLKNAAELDAKYAAMGYGKDKVMGGESKEKRTARAKARQGSGGTFVYRGAGKKHNKDATLSEHKCEKQTIDVQWCLAKNDHKQNRCQGLVAIWRECTDKWNARDPQNQDGSAATP